MLKIKIEKNYKTQKQKKQKQVTSYLTLFILLMCNYYLSINFAHYQFYMYLKYFIPYD